MTLAYASPYRMPSPRDPNEPASPIGGAEMLTPDGRSLPFAGATLRIEAGAGLARVVLEQTFENPFPDTLRVTYKMPLPVDGAVSGYAFTIGSRTITGKVDRKESARARFEEAIVQGKTAALLEQDKADIFTQELGNVPPHQTIVARITIDQRLAWKPEGEWELRFPTVIGPRYLESQLTSVDRKASHVHTAVADERGNGAVRARIQLEAKIADTLTVGRRVESPSHKLVARADGVVELSDLAGARLDRDVVLRWSVAKRDVGLELQIARPAAGAPHAHNAYGLLSIVPPSPDAGYATVPRDLIVLLDTSGSMEGGPLEQGKRVVAMLIESLTERDRLEVIEFSMRPNRFTNAPVPGTKREKERAIHWVMSRKADGGTEMQSAIYDALQGLRKGAQRQVVLVTDGYVGGEEQLVAMLHENLPESCRMHVVGVGSGVNRALATSIARAGRGAELLVGLDEDAERCAVALVDKTRAPVLTDVTITGDALVEHAPEHLPDVFAGSPIVAALKLRASGGDLVVRGNTAAGVWTQKVRMPAIDAGEGNAAVTALFAREQVADLEVRWSIGKETRAIDADIERIGLVFQISTRRTSWVAIDEDRTVDPRLGSQHVEVPQELPYGTSAASFGLAAPMPMALQMAMAAPLASMAESDALYDAEELVAAQRPASYSKAASFDLDDEDARSMVTGRAIDAYANEPGRDEGSYGGMPADDEPATIPPPPAQMPEKAKKESAPPPAMSRARMPAPAAPPAPRPASGGFGAPPPGAGAPQGGGGPMGAPPPPVQPQIAPQSRLDAPSVPAWSDAPRAAQKRARNRARLFFLLFLAIAFLVALATYFLFFYGP